MSAFQDKEDELRALINGMTGYVDFSLKRAENSIQATYSISNGNVITKSLIPDDSTPDLEGDDLDAWAIQTLGIEADAFGSACWNYDDAYDSVTNILGVVAQTYGQNISVSDRLTESERIASQRRMLRSMFTRLKIKGTEKSYDILGRLHGFSDTVYTPLWSRLSVRNPADLLDQSNASDLRDKPEMPVDSPAYNPKDIADGPAYTWTATGLSIVPSSTSYLSLKINGDNPYIKVVLTGILSRPANGFYYLAGGDENVAASISPLNGAGAPSGMTIESISTGAAMNGLRIIISGDSATTFDIQASHSLSLIKYLSSLFDLSYRQDYDAYALLWTDVVASNPDLQNSPDLTTDGTSVSPYRPWTGGTSTAADIDLWPARVVNTAQGAVTGRSQSAGANRQVNIDPLNEDGRLVYGKIDDIRPATRSVRKFTTGFSVTDQLQWAAYPELVSITSLGAVPISGTVAGDGTDVPVGSYTASFHITNGVTTYQVSAESDPVISGRVNLVGQDITGWWNYETGSYFINPSVNYTGWSFRLCAMVLEYETVRVEPVIGANILEVGYLCGPEDGQTETDLGLKDGIITVRPIRLDGMDTGYSYDNIDSEYVQHSQTLTVDGLGGSSQILAINSQGRRPRLITSTAGGICEKRVTVDGFKPYAIGRTLVADALSFTSAPFQEGLDTWLRFGDHPDDGFIVEDLGTHAVTPEDLSSGLYQSTVIESDRVWDEDRGWVVSAQDGRAIRYLPQEITPSWTFAFWIRPKTLSSSSGTVASYGKWEWVLAGTSLSLKYDNTYLLSTTLTVDVWKHVYLSISPVDVSSTVDIKRSYSSNVTLSGIPVGLGSGDRVLAYGQTNSIENDIYSVNSGVWVPISSSWRATAGALVSDGEELLRLISINPVVMSSVSHTWSYKTGGYVSAYTDHTPVQNSVLITDETASPVVTTSYGLNLFSDLMIWRVAKTTAQMDVVRRPNVRPIMIAEAYAEVGEVSGGVRYRLETTPYGYVYPSLDTFDYGYIFTGEQLRYTPIAEFSGHDDSERVGLGDGPVRAESRTLGMVDGLQVDGGWAENTCTISSVYPESSLKWRNSSVSGYKRNTYNWPGIPVESTQAFPTPAVSTLALLQAESSWYFGGLDEDNEGSWFYDNDVWQYVPGSLGTYAVGATNPIRRRVYHKQGDVVYAIGVTTDPIPYLYAERAAVQNDSGSLRWLSPSAAQSLQLKEYRSIGTTILGDTSGSLVVTESSGTPVVGDGAALATTPPPVFLYGEYVGKQSLTLNDASVANNSSIWINPTTVGLALGAVARDTSGNISIAGTGILSPGRYVVELDLSLYGTPDEDFFGFNLEVTIDSNHVVTKTALRDGNQSFIFSWKTDRSQAYDANISGLELLTRLNSMPAVVEAGGLELIGNNRLGGPYTYRWLQVGFRELPTIDGMDAQVTDVVVGGASTQASFMISLRRTVYRFDVTIGGSTGGSWTTNIYWSNSLRINGVERRTLLLHGIKVNQRKAVIYKIDYNPVRASQVIDPDAGYDSAVPGGWRSQWDLDGNVESNHESTLYAEQNFNSSKSPTALLLTMSTNEKQNSLELS